MSTAPWIVGMRGANVPDVAVALGKKRGRKVSDGISGCPSCGAECRHSKSHDSRGAVGIRPDGKGWRCHQCDTSGDAIDLVARELRGRRFAELDREEKTEVRTWCCTWLGIADTTPTRSSSAPTNARPTRRPAITRAEMPEPEAAPEPEHVPADVLAEFIEQGTMLVDRAPPTIAWFESKRIDSCMVADFDLARALTPGAEGCYPMPEWARYGRRSWRADGYHVIFRQYDATGTLRSVIARNVLADGLRRRVFDVPIPKSLPPRGYARRGLVLLCPLALQVFRTCARPDWWPTDVPLRFEVCEGEKKWLQRVLMRDADETAPAVIGIESGSWQLEHAARIPDGSELLIATDQNNAGAQYATAIVNSLIDRIRTGAIRLELRPEFALGKNDRGDVRVELRKAAA